MNTSTPVRVAAFACAALLLAGCSTINPITTDRHYQPSDGFEVAIGDDAKAMNLLVITSAVDAPAVLTGTVYNGDFEPIDVSFSLDGTTFVDVAVPALGSAVLGPDGTVVEGVATAAPGGIAQVMIRSDATGQFSAPVPVVDGTLPEYRDIVDALPTLQPDAAE